MTEQERGLMHARIREYEPDFKAIFDGVKPKPQSICDNCIKQEVCKYQDEAKKLEDNITASIDDVFTLKIGCKHKHSKEMPKCGMTLGATERKAEVVDCGNGYSKIQRSFFKGYNPRFCFK